MTSMAAAIVEVYCTARGFPPNSLDDRFAVARRGNDAN